MLRGWGKFVVVLLSRVGKSRVFCAGRVVKLHTGVDKGAGFTRLSPVVLTSLFHGFVVVMSPVFRGFIPTIHKTNNKLLNSFNLVINCRRFA